MARRERGESPHGALTSEQRSQTPYSPLALRVALNFGLSCVAPQSQTHEGYAPSLRLAQVKIQQQCGLSLLLSQLLSLILFAGGLMQAQESDSLPPPKPPFVHNAPTTAAWTVTFKPKTKAKPAPTPAKDGGPGAAAQDVPRVLKAVQFFKAGNKRRVIYYWSDGTNTEKWLVNGAIYVEQMGNPEVREVREISNALLPVMTPDLETYSDTDFPEFRWIQAGMYVPESAVRDPSGQNRPHYLFRSIPQPTPAEPDKPAKPSKPLKNAAEQMMLETYKSFRGKRKKNTNSGSYAWIDAATQLPIAFDDGVNMQYYSFDPNPPSSLEMPARFADAMTRKKKISEALARDKMQAN